MFNTWKSIKPIFEATKRNDERAIKHYVEKVHIPVTSRNAEKQTAAHIAAEKGNLSILKYLLGKDESILEFRDIEDNTVLHVAVVNGGLDMVKYLVNDVNADLAAGNQIQENNTAIHMAAENGHVPILKFFIEEKNVNVDVRNDAGETCVFLAAAKPHMDAVRYLVEVAKANVTATDDKNENILFVSAKLGDLNVPRYLLDELKIDFDVDWKDSWGYTLVHMASMYNNLESLKYFVEKKHANVELGNNMGWTALHEAASAGNVDVVQFLLERGADIERRNINGKTPLQVTSDKLVKKYLKEKLHKRDRRSVTGPLIRRPMSKPGQKFINCFTNRNEGCLVQIEDKYRHSNNTPLNSYQLQFFLAFANTIVKSRQAEPIFLISPSTSILDRMDTLAIDVVDGVSNNYMKWNARFSSRSHAC